jgi:predicted ribosome quality control (RQC) complex YloA/Tae2 family protein
LRKSEAELKGNLLLANLSKIPRGSKSVELPNIFSAESEIVRIKLNPAKSVQENARQYYEKYKNLAPLKTRLSVRRERLNTELQYWQELSAKAAANPSPPQLEKIKKELIRHRVLQDRGAPAEAGETTDYSFHRLLLGKKWEVFIGRNARNNERLTFKFARKDDMWFHVQGASGSHVVLRLGSRESLPPPEIMAQVAQAAAYFSSAKHSALVPVNYTRVRYVRKVRNKPAGTVLISREKTLFVKPEKPD